MKYLIVICLLIGACCVSCDGRISKSESLKASIERFNNQQSNTTTITYYPKEYTEIRTDTLLSNGTKISIKNYSLAADSIFISEDQSSIPKKIKRHRVFASDVLISTISNKQFSFQLSAEDFKFKNSEDFWNAATLQHVWVNQELSNSADVILELSFINPKDNSFKMYHLSINSSGHQTAELIAEDYSI